MRIEPGHQKLLSRLLEDLEIRDERKTLDGLIKKHHADRGSEDAPELTHLQTVAQLKNTAHLIDFPQFSSPVEQDDPKYNLKGEENEQKSPLDLMKLGFVRMLGKLSAGDVTGGSENESREKQCLTSRLEHGIGKLTRAAASRQSDWKSAFQEWINELDERDYQYIREHAKFEGTSLYQLGLWNVLSDVLSHDAVMKLRDLGTFYHLLTENPNAAEWFVLWLRGLKTTNKLQGIHGGMRCITKKLKELLGTKVQCKCDRELVNIHLEPDGPQKIVLKFLGKRSDKERETTCEIAERVILAIPKAPLQKLVLVNERHFPDNVKDQIDAVFGFPMVKVFIVVKKRWWEEEHRANVYATRIPTRELHYWRSKLEGSTKGMIMIYTDRPASSFWANYVGATGAQEAPEWGEVSESWKTVEPADPASGQRRRLLTKLLQYIREGGVQTVGETDIEYYGIRDWGREPYVGANHAWRPERKSWECLKSLSKFKLSVQDHSASVQDGSASVHICGEAYSDYQGFMEGSLRSAAHVLHMIEPGAHPTETPWLCGCGKCCEDTGSQPARLAKTREPWQAGESQAPLASAQGQGGQR